MAKGLLAGVSLTAALLATLAVQAADKQPRPAADHAVSPAADHAGPAAASQAAPAYVGAEACRDCHADQFDAWASSTHGTAAGPPGPETALAPFDGPPIRFADAVVSPQVDDAGRYVFVVERPGRPPARYEVSGVVGRGHMVGGGTQGFLSAFPDGTQRFLPFDWSTDAGVWFCNTAFVGGFWVPGADRAALRADAGWLPITPETRLTDCGDWPPVRVMGATRRFANCQNCHGSGVEVAYRPDERRYETAIATLRIDCESCHGPAADHVERARSGLLATSPELGLPALDTLDVDQSLAVCFQCHALKRSLGDAPALADPLPDPPLPDPPPASLLPPSSSPAQPPSPSTRYSLGLPLVGDSPYLPDGRIRTFGYQQTHRSSACYLSGAMTCVDCHDPHALSYRDPFGAPLAGRWDDGQCTACHASKAADPESHTFHPPASEGARCVACHMPYVQHPELSDAIPYARSDHTIPVPRPGFDEAAGLPSACAGCHQDRTPAALADQATQWWGELKPHRPEVAALFSAAFPGAASPARPSSGAQSHPTRPEDLAAPAAPSPAGAHGPPTLSARPLAIPPPFSAQTAPAVQNAFSAQATPSAQTTLAALTTTAALGERHALAKLMALNAWVLGAAASPDRAVAPSATAALTALAGDPDIDVRAVAAAALHATHDADHPALRALFAPAAAPPASAAPPSSAAVPSSAVPPSPAARPSPPASPSPAFQPRTAAVRVRWAAALSQWAAALSRSHGPPAALPFLQKARQLRPSDPEALIGLAAGLAAVGAHAQAVRVYQDALRLDPDHPVALVNLGLGLEALGRADEAEAAYQRAATARPGEALAHFNLGNARFRRGDLPGAGVAYRAAVEADPGLARAHFYLAVVLVNTGGDPEAALSALYTAAEFAPDDEEVRRVLRQVEAAVRGPGG